MQRSIKIKFSCGDTVIFQNGPGGIIAHLQAGQHTISQHQDGTMTVTVLKESALVLRDLLNQWYPPAKQPAVQVYGNPADVVGGIRRSAVLEIKHSEPHDWNNVVPFEAKPKSEV